MYTALTIIVPSFNEACNLKLLVPQWITYCRSRCYKLIIINDGSTDESKKILDSYDDPVLKVIHHKVNRGYGAALKTGISHASTEYLATMDADGQHLMQDIDILFDVSKSTDADLVIGSRAHLQIDTAYRKIGKWIIRKFTKTLMPLPINDLNSGMKLYRTELAKNYIKICPDSMAFSDTIVLIFLNQRHLVTEQPITVLKREKGRSTIGIHTAFDTIWKILIVTMLFRPIKIFLPISFLAMALGLLWGVPFVLTGRGVSVGASLSIITGVIFFFFGLIAEQLSLLIKSKF